MNQTKEDRRESIVLYALCVLAWIVALPLRAITWWQRRAKEKRNTRMKHIILFATDDTYREQHRKKHADVIDTILTLALLGALGLLLLVITGCANSSIDNRGGIISGNVTNSPATVTINP